MRANGTRTQIFPVETLREAAALGFGGIYVKDDVGGAALSRLDAAHHLRGAGAGLHLDRGLYLDPQHGGLDDRCLRPRCAAQAISAQALHHGAFRELLPDRAGRRLGRRKPATTRACATATTTCSNGAKAFISGGGVSDIYVCMVRTGGAGPEGHLLHRGREGHAGPVVRRAGEKARLEIAADRDGDFRGLPRAGRESARQRRATASRSR